MVKVSTKRIQALLMLVLVSLSLCPLAAETQALEQAQLELSGIAEAIKELQSRLKKSSADQQQLEQEMLALDQELGKLHKNMRIIATQRTALEDSLSHLGNQDRRIQADVQKQYQSLKQQLRLYYLDNQLSEWKMALAQINPAYSGRDRMFYRYIQEARNQELKQLTALSETIAAQVVVVNKRRLELQAVLAGQQQQTEILQQARAQKINAQAMLTRYIENDQRQLKAQTKARQALEKLLKKLRRQSLPDQKFAQQGGKLSWPVKGDLENQFGDVRQQHSNQLTWEGVTISSARGKQIRAIYAGRVIFSDWFKGYGWLMIIDHGDGYMSLYAHAEGLYKEVGERVEQNEVIAMVGDSGGSRKAKTYFEIRRKGQPLNPEKWCG